MISRRTLVLGVLVCGGALPWEVPAFARSSRPASFAAIDADRDGTLDLDEVKKAAAALFDKLDADHDGTLTRRELRRPLSAADLGSGQAEKQGTLTKEDFLAIVERRFQAADTDHDGTLSPAEFRSRAGLALWRLLH
jgi:Ca2+-binding EF-hand superfamily protein